VAKEGLRAAVEPRRPDDGLDRESGAPVDLQSFDHTIGSDVDPLPARRERLVPVALNSHFAEARAIRAGLATQEPHDLTVVAFSPYTAHHELDRLPGTCAEGVAVAEQDRLAHGAFCVGKGRSGQFSRQRISKAPRSASSSVAKPSRVSVLSCRGSSPSSHSRRQAPSCSRKRTSFFSRGRVLSQVRRVCSAGEWGPYGWRRNSSISSRLSSAGLNIN